MTDGASWCSLRVHAAHVTSDSNFFISDAFIFFPSYKVMRVAPQSDEEVSSLRDLLQSRKDVNFG